MTDEEMNKISHEMFMKLIESCESKEDVNDAIHIVCMCLYHFIIRTIIKDELRSTLQKMFYFIRRKVEIYEKKEEEKRFLRNTNHEKTL